MDKSKPIKKADDEAKELMIEMSNNYKTLIDNIFNYTEDSDEYDILYDSDISEESTISIRSDYSEDLITPLLTSQA